MAARVGADVGLGEVGGRGELPGSVHDGFDEAEAVPGGLAQVGIGAEVGAERVGCQGRQRQALAVDRVAGAQGSL